MLERQPRRSFDKEFKLSAVKLVLESEKSVESIASELGVSSNTLFNWKRKYLEDAKNAFPGKGRMKPEDEEVWRVKKELLRVTMERDILKKALGHFAKVKE